MGKIILMYRYYDKITVTKNENLTEHQAAHTKHKDEVGHPQ